MITGIARNLTCTITLTNVDDIIVMVNFTWSFDGGSLPTVPRISTSGSSQSGNQSNSTSSIIFNPLDSNTDNGNYRCVVMVDSNTADTFITPIAANNNLSVAVECESPFSAVSCVRVFWCVM